MIKKEKKKVLFIYVINNYIPGNQQRQDIYYLVKRQQIRPQIYVHGIDVLVYDP